MGDVMVMSYIPLGRYCRESGISYRQVQMMIYHSVDSGIVASGAVKRLGGRWYVVPDQMAKWIDSQTEDWSRKQVSG